MSNIHDFDIQNGVLTHYNGSDADIFIPDSVTSIGDNAFSGCKRLISVMIPDGVTSIGYGAFQYCRNLSKVNIPDGVTSIDAYAFCGCESLTEINLPEKLLYIGESAFSSCSSLSSLRIPGSVASISDEAFGYCRNLSSVVIQEGVWSIGYQSFGNCSSLKSIKIPDSLNEFNEEMYKWGNSVFHENTIVILNHYIKDIEKKNVSKRLAFCKTPIQEIKSTNAKKLAVKGFLSVEDLSVYDDAVIASYKEYLKQKVINYVDYILANDVDMIIRRLASLELIDSKLVDKLLENNLPDEIQSLLSKYKKDDGENGGTKKNSANKEPSVTELKKNWSFKKNKDGLTITSYKGDDLTVIVPETIGKDIVTEIGVEAFSAQRSGLSEKQKRVRGSITEISIPTTVKSIGSNAFTGCSCLLSITIPDSVMSFGYSVFVGCTSLTEIIIPSGVTSLKSSTFSGCSNLAKAVIPDSVKQIGSFVFNNCFNLTIYAHEKSYAEEYAKENNIPYEPLD